MPLRHFIRASSDVDAQQQANFFVSKIPGSELVSVDKKSSGPSGITYIATIKLASDTAPGEEGEGG